MTSLQVSLQGSWGAEPPLPSPCHVPRDTCKLAVMSGNSGVLVSLCLGAALVSFGCDSGKSAGAFLVPDSAPGGEADAEAGTEGDGDGDAGDGDGDMGNSTTPPTEACDVPSPYMGGWDIGCCQDEVVPGPWAPGGVGPGTVIPDWTFTDQFGDAVRIYDFCHEAIYFDYVAMWCPMCQAHAPELANLFNSYDARGLMTLTYMSESEEGGPATQADVQAWADTYAQKGMVVFSSLEDVWYPFGVDQGGDSYAITLPGTMLVGTNAKISKLGIPTIEELEMVIPGE